jgi:undecaprenyl-diphosphatase
MLVVGALGQVFIFEGSIGRVELEWTDWVARHRIGVLDAVATVGSSLTDTWTVIGVAFGASVILWVTGNRRHASMLPIGLAVELAAFLAVSTIIGRERPDVTPLGSVPSTASFPSGHVAAGVVLYGGLVLIAASVTGSNAVTRGASIPAVVVITYVATARIYEGVHHPTDVVGGALLGIGALFVAASSTGLMAPARRTSGARASGGGRALKATGP